MRFNMICEANGVEPRLTKPKHPWNREDQKTVRGAVFLSSGQVERINRTIKHGGGGKRLIQWINRSRNVKRYHHDGHDQLRGHLADFHNAYSFARRLKTLGGLTPHEYICKSWTSEPDRFIVDPIHQVPALNTQGTATERTVRRLASADESGRRVGSC